MGALCSAGFGSSSMVRVDCPLEVVWECIADFHRYPDFIPRVISVHGLNKEENMKLMKSGTRWRETRLFRGEHFIILKTVTSVADHEKDSKSVSIHSDFTESNTRAVDLEHSVHTCTFVVTRSSPEQCELHGSYAAVYGTWGRRLISACCQWYLPKEVEASFEHELNAIAKEAVARYQLSQGKKSTTS